jgi:hypothetical protein
MLQLLLSIYRLVDYEVSRHGLSAIGFGLGEGGDNHHNCS